MKSFKKLFISICLIFLTTSSVNAKLIVVEWKCKKFNEYTELGIESYGAVGIIHNTGKNKYSGVSVQISLLGDDNLKLGDALDFTAGLAPGQKWKFKAEGMAEGVKKCGTPEVTGY